MSGREWKPGDVALIRVGDDYSPEVAVRGGGIFRGKWYVGGPRYGSQHGWPDDRVTVVRPLVVLDHHEFPRTMVKHLRTAFNENPALTTLAWLADQIEAQTASKPPEPRGRYAVVVDAEGREWCRTRDDLPGYLGVVWMDPERYSHRAYADIAAVRVLSPGVTP